MIDVATAGTVAATVVAVRVSWTPAVAAFVLTASIGMSLALADLRVRRLPFPLSGAIASGSVVAFLAASLADADHTALVRSLAAGLVVSGLFSALALIFAGQLGLGDVIFAGTLALSLGWLGWRHVAVGMVIGTAVQALLSAGLTALGRINRRESLPFGPALLAGWFVSVLTAS